MDFFGIDPSKIAFKEINKEIILKTGSADNLPFSDNFFDLVVFGFAFI